MDLPSKMGLEIAQTATQAQAKEFALLLWVDQHPPVFGKANESAVISAMIRRRKAQTVLDVIRTTLSSYRQDMRRVDEA